MGYRYSSWLLPEYRDTVDTQNSDIVAASWVMWYGYPMGYGRCSEFDRYRDISSDGVWSVVER